MGKKHNDKMAHAGYFVHADRKKKIDDLALQHAGGNASRFVDEIFLDVITYHSGKDSDKPSS